MRKDLKILLSACSMAALVFALAPSEARAQMMDYGSLESLFGESVTTSATGTPQRASEVATNMTIITAAQIRQSGSRSIPEIIGMYVAGMNIFRTGANAFDVGVRGYQQPYQPRLLVMLDGKQIFNDDYSRTVWGSVPVDINNIRQIEVVKGASSALFGSNASGGVINIITYSPTFDQNNEVSVAVGTGNALRGDGTTNIRFGDYGAANLSAGGVAQNEFKQGRTQTEADAVKNVDQRYIAQNSEFNVSDKLKILTQASYSRDDDMVASFRYTITPTVTRSYSVGGGFAWQNRFGVLVSNNYLNSHEEFMTALGLGRAKLTNRLVNSHLEQQFKVGADHTLRAMVEYRHNSFFTTSDPTRTGQRGHFEGSHYATGGTWLWNINDKLSFANAVRLEHSANRMVSSLHANNTYEQSDYTRTYNSYAVNSGLVYKPTEKDTFRLTFGRGIQNPGLMQNGNVAEMVLAPTVSLLISGNPKLKPTVVQNYELSYDRKIPQINSLATLSVYTVENRDVAAYTSLAPTVVGGITYLHRTFVNGGESYGSGGEFSLTGSHPIGLRWNGSYSYQMVYDSSNLRPALEFQDSTPHHQFRLNLGYTKGPWELDGHGQIVTRTNMLRSYNTGTTNSRIDTEGYATLGARIGYNINDRFTVALSGNNIERELIRENPYVQTERQGYLTLTGKF